jgi:putative acetyltransferase
MGAIRKIDNETCELKRMRTEPGHQGKGFGKIILVQLVKYAKQLHYKKIILETSDKQIAAHLLYKKAGFSEFKKEVIDGFNCTWYELRV